MFFLKKKLTELLRRVFTAGSRLLFFSHSISLVTRVTVRRVTKAIRLCNNVDFYSGLAEFFFQIHLFCCQGNENFLDNLKTFKSEVLLKTKMMN